MAPHPRPGLDREQVTLQEKSALMRRHMALNLDFYGPQTGLVLFRKHAARYIQGLPGEALLREPLLTANTVAEFDARLRALLQPTFRAELFPSAALMAE